MTFKLSTLSTNPVAHGLARLLPSFTVSLSTGKEIQIERKLRNPIITLFKKIVKSKAGVITVAEAIEGEDIKLEYTIAKRVTGRRINIGKGCQIELVQYSDSVEVSPKATVRTKEQV